MVHLSDHIKGLVPRTHLSDIVLKNPEKKYVEGMKIKCRVSHRPVRSEKVSQMQLKLGRFLFFLPTIFPRKHVCAGAVSGPGQKEVVPDQEEVPGGQHPALVPQLR